MAKPWKEKIKNISGLYWFLKKSRAFFYRLVRPKQAYLFLNSLHPLSPVYGLDRGQPIDRFYIENFLAKESHLIKGRILEVMENRYSRQFGKDKVTVSDVLDIDDNNPRANIIGDLRDLKNIADNSYDCIILTQVLQFIDEPTKAIKECHRLLKVGGVLLATLPTISRVDCVAGQAGDYWRFTAASARYLLEKHFSPANLTIEPVGNLLASLNFLIGLAREEMETKKLSYQDNDFPCLICVKAIK